MPDTFELYMNAAAALLEAPDARLEELTAEGTPEALRLAVQDTLLVKTEFAAPEGAGYDRRAVTILAASLQDDPAFTPDVAIRLTEVGDVVGGRSETRGPAHPMQRSNDKPWRLSLSLGLAAVILLAFEVLAMAGVPVPNPLGEIIDRFSADAPRAYAKSTSAPPSWSVERSGLDHAFSERPLRNTHPPSAHESIAARLDDRERGRDASGEAKNPNHANGKERNQANGTLRNGVEEPNGGPPPVQGRPADPGPPEEEGPPRHARVPQHAGDARNERAGNPAGR